MVSFQRIDLQAEIWGISVFPQRVDGKLFAACATLNKEIFIIDLENASIFQKLTNCGQSQRFCSLPVSVSCDAKYIVGSSTISVGPDSSADDDDEISTATTLLNVLKFFVRSPSSSPTLSSKTEESKWIESDIKITQKNSKKKRAGFYRPITCVTFSPTCPTELVVCSRSGGCCIFDLETQSVKSILTECEPKENDNNGVMSCKYSKDGRYIAAVTKQHTILIFDVKKSKSNIDNNNEEDGAGVLRELSSTAHRDTIFDCVFVYPNNSNAFFSNAKNNKNKQNSDNNNNGKPSSLYLLTAGGDRRVILHDVNSTESEQDSIVKEMEVHERCYTIDCFGDRYVAAATFSKSLGFLDLSLSDPVSSSAAASEKRTKPSSFCPSLRASLSPNFHSSAEISRAVAVDVSQTYKHTDALRTVKFAGQFMISGTSDGQLSIFQNPFRDVWFENRKVAFWLRYAKMLNKQKNEKEEEKRMKIHECFEVFNIFVNVSYYLF